VLSSNQKHTEKAVVDSR